MAIQIRYFAALRDYVGHGEAQTDAPASVAQIWTRVNPGLPLPNNTLVAVNHVYATLDTPVQDGEEVAFFPPVTGG